MGDGGFGAPVIWDGGAGDDVVERGEGEVEFLSHQLDELCVDLHHFGDRADKIWVNGSWAERQIVHLSMTMRWLMTVEASSGKAFLFTDLSHISFWAHLDIRFDTAADDIDSPGCADETVDHRIIQDHGFDSLQSLVRCDRSQDSFP